MVLFRSLPVVDVQLSLWVGTELLQCALPEERSEMLSGLVSTAKVATILFPDLQECVSLRNYNDAFAIMAGLGGSSVRRLNVVRCERCLSSGALGEPSRSHHEGFPGGLFDSPPSTHIHMTQSVNQQELQLLISPDENFRMYRRDLEAITVPAVPYFGLYLRLPLVARTLT